MKFRKDEIVRLVWLSVVVTFVQFALSRFVYPLIPGISVTQNAFSIAPTTALASATFGDKILGILSGIIPFGLTDVMTWLSILIGTFLVLFAGYSVFGKMPRSLQGKTKYQKLLLVLFYGTVVLGAVLMVTKWSSVAAIRVPLLVGLLINYALVAAAVFGLAKTKIGQRLIVV